MPDPDNNDPFMLRVIAKCTNS